MARPLRIEYEGAFYHVFSRGNKKQPIFHTARDRHTFLKTLERMSERFDVTIFAYVLMNNHYHLLLRTNYANLSKSMHWLGTTYTTNFNLANSQTGHLFQGRFKSIVVENESYLLRLSYYIHRNPLRAGLSKRLADYKWSTYPVYAYNRRCPSWLDTRLILSQFTPSDDVHKAYREKVQVYSKEKISTVEDIKHGVICGSSKFVDRIKEKYLSGRELHDVPDYKRIVDHKNAEAILLVASKFLQTDVDQWKSCRRISKTDMVKRDMLLYLLWQSGCFTNAEIGRYFGLSISSVTRRVGIFSSALEMDKKLRLRYKDFSAIIKV